MAALLGCGCIPSAGAPYPLRDPQHTNWSTFDGASNYLWNRAEFANYKIGGDTAADTTEEFFKHEQLAKFTWGLNDLGTQQSLTLRLEVAGNAPRNTFGVYAIATGGGIDMTNGKIEIFPGSASPTSGQYATMTLSAGSNGSLIISMGSQSITATSGQFGWYINPNGAKSVNNYSGYFYSEDFRNPGTAGNKIQMLSYATPANFQYDTTPPFDVLLAWEDLVRGASGSDADYNDLVVSIGTVPEPASILLSLTAALGVVGVVRRRRRMSKQTEL